MARCARGVTALLLGLLLPEATRAATAAEWKNRTVYQVLTDRFATLEALEGLAGVAATLQEALGPGEVEVAVAPDLPPGVQTLGPVRVRVALE